MLCTQPDTVNSPVSDALDDLGVGVEAAELLVDLLRDIVLEESHHRRGEQMDAKLQGQIVVLFDSIRDRLAKAKDQADELSRALVRQ